MTYSECRSTKCVGSILSCSPTISAAILELLEASDCGCDQVIGIALVTNRDDIASFEGVTLSETREGNEILPIEYSDNYVTIYPGETAETHGAIWKDDNPC